MNARERSPLRVHVTYEPYEPQGWSQWVVRCPACPYVNFLTRGAALKVAGIHGRECGPLRDRWFADAVRLAAVVADLDRLAADLLAEQCSNSFRSRLVSPPHSRVRALADRYRSGSAS